MAGAGSPTDGSAMGAELFQQRDEWLRRLDESIDDFKAEGLRCADKNREYRRLSAQRMVELRRDKTPVGVCETIIKGDMDVSTAKYDAECAEVLMSAAKESINAAKRHLDVIREDIEKEYQR